MDGNAQYSQQVGLYHLDLSALRQLGQSQQYPMEVREVVEHGNLEQVGFTEHKVIMAHIEE